MSMLASAHGVRNMGGWPIPRTCEQCGTVFAPRREHARFCRPRCRVAWNREHTGDPQAEASALVAWRWRPVPEPDLGSLPPRGQMWETTRYRAYQVQLAGHTIGETSGQAAAFLKLAAPHTAAA
jgi:hypothetical protein